MGNCNRKRWSTISFRVTSEERRQIEARVRISGMSRAEYFIQSLIHQEINIIAGKYASDRLSLEIRRLKDAMAKIEDLHDEEQKTLIEDCKLFLKELIDVIDSNMLKDKKSSEK